MGGLKNALRFGWAKLQKIQESFFHRTAHAQVADSHHSHTTTLQHCPEHTHTSFPAPAQARFSPKPPTLTAWAALPAARSPQLLHVLAWKSSHGKEKMGQVKTATGRAEFACRSQAGVLAEFLLKLVFLCNNFPFLWPSRKAARHKVQSNKAFLLRESCW